MTQQDQRNNGEHRNDPEHSAQIGPVIYVASPHISHSVLAPVNPATPGLVRLLAIRACGAAHSDANAQAAEFGDTINRPDRLVMDTFPARHRASYAP